MVKLLRTAQEEAEAMQDILEWEANVKDCLVILGVEILASWLVHFRLPQAFCLSQFHTFSNWTCWTKILWMASCWTKILWMASCWTKILWMASCWTKISQVDLFRLLHFQAPTCRHSPRMWGGAAKKPNDEQCNMARILKGGSKLNSEVEFVWIDLFIIFAHTFVEFF